MGYDPFRVVRNFEEALCEYTGARYAVTTTSCTMALLLAVAWHLRQPPRPLIHLPPVEIPKRTYVGVPMSIIHAGGRPTFRDEEWEGSYQLRPLPVYDSARWFTSGMCKSNFPEPIMACVSFHWKKTLAIGQGGAILHNDDIADPWLRKMRFDGRTENINPNVDLITLGWHCYMSPRDAADGISRLAVLPQHNAPLENDDYPDLSTLEIFK